MKVTYAADWSEYHHTDGGWYHLDPLWSSSAIDMVGIDAYFPLSDAVQIDYDIDALRTGWISGEGYDFYYTDTARTTQASLSAPYAWKNIDWWWNNHHVNPDSTTTAWTPGSKPIWFHGIWVSECRWLRQTKPNVFHRQYIKRKRLSAFLTRSSGFHGPAHGHCGDRSTVGGQ